MTDLFDFDYRAYINSQCFLKPSCAAWLHENDAAEPAHLCQDTLQASVEYFASERLVPYLHYRVFADAWPFPIGHHDIATVWRGALKIHRIPDDDNPAFIVPALPSLHEPSWLAAAWRRAAGTGIVWRLGLSKPVSDEEGIWEWVAPYVLTEGARTPADLDALTAVVRPLLTWYNTTLLGKSVKAPVGRPPGSKKYWQDKENFIAAVRAAIKAIEQTGRPATQEAVAEYISLNFTPLARPHASADYSERQFRRDRKDFGFLTWAELKKACRE